MRQKPLFRILFAGVIAAVLVATAAATFAAVDNVRSERDREERQLSDAITSRLAQNVDGTANRIESVRGLFEATGTVAPQEFADFTERFVTADDPLLFIAWNPRVAANRRVEFRNRTDRPVTVPGTSEPVRGQAPSFPVAMISRRFREHIGADPNAEAVRAAALRRARETRQTQVSGKVTLRDETDGVIFATPVYQRRADGAAVLRGYATGAYDLGALRESVLQGFDSGAAIRVSNANGELISSGGEIGDGAATGTVEAASGPWVVEVD
ncbi:MAG: CHASE domain-containing protein, partial [Miltoncostaeaceae bacterium]